MTDRSCGSCKTPVPDAAAFCPNCGAATPTDLNIEFGEGFEDRLSAALSERYRIDGELGRGGMAVVFLAHDLKHDRSVALKVMRPELAASIGTDRFLREIQIAAKLSHPHILGVYDSGESEGFLYYVMPYVEGESLRERMNRDGPLPIEESLRIAREVAAALSYAHSLDIVHRDIKPENILLHHGEAVVADFGIARAVTAAGGERLTETGMAIGTPLYMSPEQASGEQKLDGRSDIYSLGCVLYEMLTGEPPYTGPTAQAIVAKKLSEAVPRVSVVRERVPGNVEAALDKALARERADRFTTGTEFAEALAGEAVEWAEPTVAAIGVRRRKRAVWGASAALVVAVAAAAVVVLPRLVERGPQLDPRRVVVIPLENRTGDPALDELGVMAADYIGQAIQQVERVDVVPAAYARQYAEDAVRGGTGDVVRAVALRTRAGLAVSGTIHAFGDSLRSRVEIIDIGSGRPLQSIPESWARGAQGKAIDDLARRVAGAFAFELDPMVEVGTAPLPSAPLLEAYREHRLGYQAHDVGDYEAALEHQKAAYALDTTFILAVVAAGWAAFNIADYAQSDSLVDFADRRRRQLSRAVQLNLDVLQSFLINDWDAGLRAAREAAPLDPKGLSAVVHADVATRVNLPREAIEALRSYDPYPEWRRDEAGFYWVVLARAHHMLGDHTQELVEASRARRQNPSDLELVLLEVEAQAALGATEEVGGLLGEVPMLSRNPGETAMIAGLELRAHGYPEAAREAFERVIEWLGERPPEEATQASHRHSLARALYGLERWEEARELYEKLAAESPGSVEYRGMVGAIAARMGNAATALEISAEVAEMTPRPDRPYQPLFVQARIAALLNRPDEAMRLLREAFFKGMPYSLELHRDMDLESLRERQDYRDLMRPKG